MSNGSTHVSCLASLEDDDNVSFESDNYCSDDISFGSDIAIQVKTPILKDEVCFHGTPLSRDRSRTTRRCYKKQG